MRRSTSAGLWLVVGGLVSRSAAQFTGWTDPKQVNASICLWRRPRAIVLRDSVYVDGGRTYWSPGLSDGQYAPPVADDNEFGFIYSLNFSVPFKLSDNQTAQFKAKPKGGSGNVGSVNYQDGDLLGNYAQFFGYGGLSFKADEYPPPDNDDILKYEAYNSGGDRPFEPRFINEKLSNDVTRYLAYGAGVSAPSENKAWYFSGLHSPTKGVIYQQFTVNMSTNAVNVSNTLISVEFDRLNQGKETWKNDTLPGNVQGRAGAEAVFVPIGARGIIVIIGGSTYASFAQLSKKSSNVGAAKSEGETFMKVVDIYDIGANQWYKQTTDSSETVPTRVQGCAVVMPAKDHSSFNIYYYGGYEAFQEGDPHSDDVWILSIPSFKWIKAKPGVADRGRVGHRCVAPYPDQMMVIGGDTPRVGTALDCLKGGVIQLLNLTSLEWGDRYDPSKSAHSEYGVPQVVQAAIGGGYSGGATLTTPAASGWQDPSLQKVFETPYPTAKITTFYPYAVAATTDRPNSNPPGSGKKKNKWLAPTLGVILGLAFVTGLIVAWLLWRRRRLLRRRGTSVPSSDENGMRIISWIRGQPSETKAMTVTTDETSPPDMSERTASISPAIPLIRHEMADTHIAELMDTSPKAELSDTPLSHGEIIDKHSHFARGASVNPSAFSSISGGDHTSTVSKASAVAGRSPTSTNEAVDSPATPNLANSSRVTSGVSGISDRDVGHLRQISEATVSSTSEDGDHGRPVLGSLAETVVPVNSPVSPNTAVSPGALSPGPVSPTAVSPGTLTMTSPAVSPPTGGERAGDDYISSRPYPASPSTASVTRKSLFHENPDDLGDRR